MSPPGTLLLLRGAVRQSKLLTLFHFGRQDDERPMSVHNQGMRFFFEGGVFVDRLRCAPLPAG